MRKKDNVSDPKKTQQWKKKIIVWMYILMLYLIFFGLAGFIALCLLRFFLFVVLYFYK